MPKTISPTGRTQTQPHTQHIPPNRARFASQVGALDPKNSDYVDLLAALQGEYQARETLIGRLTTAITSGTEDPVYGILGDFDKCRDLEQLIEAAIQRFVVDNYN